MPTKSSKGSGKVKKVMHEFKHGTLKSGRSKKKVSSRKQAVAIALSEAREAGAKIPKKRPAARKRASAKQPSRRRAAKKRSPSRSRRTRTTK